MMPCKNKGDGPIVVLSDGFLNYTGLLNRNSDFNMLYMKFD